GTAGISPSALTSVAGTLYFSGYNAALGYNSLWRYTGSGNPQLVPGQTFRAPGDLIEADGNLVFTAQVSGANGDREVFKFSGGAFTQLTNIASTGTNPLELTYFNGKIVFSAQDAPSGS
ncbi:unnamed protein product, partial [Phaeothamnion confervicola]